jgi:hypothetical protein
VAGAAGRFQFHDGHVLRSQFGWQAEHQASIASEPLDLYPKLIRPSRGCSEMRRDRLQICQERNPYEPTSLPSQAHPRSRALITASGPHARIRTTSTLFAHRSRSVTMNQCSVCRSGSGNPQLRPRNRGHVRRCDLTMRLLRDAGFGEVSKDPPTASPAS